jgi:hypothetical protein
MFAVAAGRLMQGVDYEPMRHRVVMIPLISTVVILWYAVPIQGSGQLPANFIPAEPLTAA